MLAITVLLPLIQINRHHYIDTEGVGLGNYKKTSQLDVPAGSSTTITEEITSREAGLSKISIPLLISKSTTLVLSLIDQRTGQVIRQQQFTISADPKQSSQLINWQFSPMSESADKSYELKINTPSNETFSFLTVTPERFDGGKLTVNGNSIEESRIIIDWQYYSSHPLSTVLDRLRYNKPGIFNHRSTYVILFCCLVILYGALCWFLTGWFWQDYQTDTTTTATGKQPLSGTYAP